MTIEERKGLIASQAEEIARIAEAELAKRVVYLNRAGIVVALIRDTFAVMTQVERDGVRSDFGENWRALRLRLAHSQTRLESIIKGGAMPTEDHER